LCRRTRSTPARRDCDSTIADLPSVPIFSPRSARPLTGAHRRLRAIRDGSRCGVGRRARSVIAIRHSAKAPSTRSWHGSGAGRAQSASQSTSAACRLATDASRPRSIFRHMGPRLDNVATRPGARGRADSMLGDLWRVDHVGHDRVRSLWCRVTIAITDRAPPQPAPAIHPVARKGGAPPVNGRALRA